MSQSLFAGSHRSFRHAFAAAVVLAALCGETLSAELNWPRWRGADSSGRSSETGLPLTWDTSSIAWSTPLPGQGQSSPIIWGDRIFLTTALERGKERVVFCVDRRDGKLLWEQSAWKGDPELSHVMNGWASATCATDGERVYASFGKAGLHCYTAEGKHVWSRELGEFVSKTKRGTAASPVLAGEMVIFNGDSDSDPFLFGLNKLTGETAWKVDRPKTEGYSTPILVTAGGRQELVLNGDPYVAAYEPATGKQLWFCKSFAGRGEPTPVPGDGVVYCVCGQSGDVYSVRTGGEGNVTASHMVWHTPRKSGRDQPSPILAGEYLLVSSMAGVCSCYDATTGEELWKERLGGAKYTASPIAAEGRVYFISEEGETVVLEPGPQLKVLARNKLGETGDEVFRASPTPCQGQILLRSNSRLYCIGKKAA